MGSRAMAWVRGLLALAFGLLPAAAFACSYCAARTDDTQRTLLFIGTMCLLPLVVGGAALAIIRRMDSRGEGEE